MVTLADFSDTASLMTCKRCGQLLQEGDRFCRFCGQDQHEPDPDADPESADPASPSFVDITQPPANGDDTAAPVAVSAREARRAARLRARMQAGQDDDDATPQRGPGGAVVPGRWAVGVAAAVLVVLAVALLHDLYRGGQDESTRRAELGAALAQVEEALGRGDLSEVQLKLAILDALNPNDADVKAKREAFETRVQELTAERDRLRAVVEKEQGMPAEAAAASPSTSPMTSSTAGAAAVPAASAPAQAPGPAATAATTASPATSSAAAAPSARAAAAPASETPPSASAPAATSQAAASPAVPASSTAAPPPATAPAATTASAPSTPTPAPAAPPEPPTASTSASPSSPSSPASQGACPEALAAMALCPNR